MRIIAGCDMVNTILTYKLVSNRFFLRKQSHFFVSVEIIVILC